MFVPLEEATPETCGGKAAALGALLRSGLAVPGGFVVPFAVYDAAVEDRPLSRPVMDALERALDELGDPAVAVRSSAADEDTAAASGAGQYETELAVCGIPDVAAAIRHCWASLHSSRATTYRTGVDAGAGPVEPSMAVLVQRHLDAEVSGVMFTSEGSDAPTMIEASWGLGPSVVAGTVTPDAYLVHADGTVACVTGDKPTRLDRHGARLLARAVAVEDRHRPTLDDATVTHLADLGGAVAMFLDAPQDIEWALADDGIWLLQARPITALPPTTRPTSMRPSAATLTGTPGSRGVATGTARTVRGPKDFTRVRPGDILVCPFTDPAWTPLLRVAAGVVTEAGGALSHAAIVAREHRIPAVLGVPDAVARIADGAEVTIDGTTGTVTMPQTGPTHGHPTPLPRSPRCR